MKIYGLDGMRVTGQDGRAWRLFVPGWQLWRWAGYVVRRWRGEPSCWLTLSLPEGVRAARAELAPDAKATTLGKKAPLVRTHGAS